MKKILITAIMLSSSAAFADCTVKLSSWGANGDILSSRYVENAVSKALGSKGYLVSDAPDANSSLHLHYISALTTRGSDTIGVDLKFTNSDGAVTTTKSEPAIYFLGFSDKRVAKKALANTLRDLSRGLPDCE